MAIFVKHVACPACGSRDNRAVYDDASEWCFGCGASTRSSVSGFVREAQQDDEEEPSWSLPDDLTQNFPEEILKYAYQYTITTADLIRYKFFYSRRTNRLWRLLDHQPTEALRGLLRTGQCSAEARCCDGSAHSMGPKCLFYGSKEVYPIAGTQRSRCDSFGHTLVLTEDSFSSIRVGRVCDAMPLFGTSLSITKVVHIAKDYQHVTVWLDHDKFKEAWEIALKFKWLNVGTKVVLTKLDPKCYTEKEINEYLA